MIVKTGIFPKELSKIIRQASENREKADYLDFFITSKGEAEKQIQRAEQFGEYIQKYLSERKVQNMNQNYQDINASTIDRWIEEGWEWGIPISHETYEKAKCGEWEMLLTPTKPVPKEWLGDLKGKKVLGLASGGGQQMPIFAALGAECTVLDYSGRQIESEKMVAQREGYEIRIIQGDMTKPLPFDNEEFDLIFHPISNCYVEEVKPIWKECYRILKKGGHLLAGLDNGVNYLVDEAEKEIVNSLPFNPLKNPEQRKQLEDEDCGIQFSHTLEEQIGGQLEAGFQLLSVYEDTNGEGRLHELGIPTFWATCVKK
ncbi:Methyltransferase domain-containing protein [Lachnospiraceae bacterium XBB1006]|nr:Methyltransferase domain-containing protein [Lachnospiraceae bacterium XBB1006]